MKVVYDSGKSYLLRFDQDEEIISGLQKFCEEQGVRAGYFNGIGSSKEAVLSYYDLDMKRYLDRTLSERLEVANFAGNVADLQGQAAIHTHGIFSDKDLRTYAGHIKKLVVSATCEVVLNIWEGNVVRKYDPDTGLSLIAS